MRPMACEASYRPLNEVRRSIISAIEEAGHGSRLAAAALAGCGPNRAEFDLQFAIAGRANVPGFSCVVRADASGTSAANDLGSYSPRGCADNHAAQRSFSAEARSGFATKTSAPPSYGA